MPHTHYGHFQLLVELTSDRGVGIKGEGLVGGAASADFGIFNCC